MGMLLSAPRIIDNRLNTALAVLLNNAIEAMAEGFRNSKMGGKTDSGPVVLPASQETNITTSSAPTQQQHHTQQSKADEECNRTSEEADDVISAASCTWLPSPSTSTLSARAL
jgi:hypothetical protein